MRITHVLTHFPYEECHIDRLQKVFAALGEPLDEKPFFRGRNYSLLKTERGIFWFAGIVDNMDTQWVSSWNTRFTKEFMNLIVVFIEVSGLNRIEKRLKESKLNFERIRIIGEKRFLFFRKRMELPVDILSVRVPHSGIELSFYEGDEIPADGKFIREVELRVIPDVISDYRRILFALPVRVEGSGGEYTAEFSSHQKLIIKPVEPYNRAIVRFEPVHERYLGRGLNILSLRMETVSGP